MLHVQISKIFLAPIVTDVGETRTLIQDKINGILVKPNPKSIADAILRIYNDRKLRLSIGQSARNTVEKSYNYSTMLNWHIEFYKLIMHKEL